MTEPSTLRRSDLTKLLVDRDPRTASKTSSRGRSTKASDGPRLTIGSIVGSLVCLRVKGSVATGALQDELHPATGVAAEGHRATDIWSRGHRDVHRRHR